MNCYVNTGYVKIYQSGTTFILPFLSECVAPGVRCFADIGRDVSAQPTSY